VDKFRIKIWDKNNGDVIVYDNQMGADDNNSNPSLRLTEAALSFTSEAATVA